MDGATLIKLHVLVSRFIGRPIIFTLGQNEHFFSRLQEVSVEIESEGSYFIEGIRLLQILTTTTSKIHTLQFKIGEIDDCYKQEVYYLFVNIIRSQQQLRRFNLIYDIELEMKLNGIIPALECQRNSLQEIKIFNCDYNLSLEKLIKSKNLEVFRMSYCEEYRLLKPLINNHCKISTLEIISFDLYESVVNQLAQYLKKSGTLLQRLKLDSEEGIESQSSLLEALMTCSNLTYLYISPIIFSAQVPKFIEKLQKLQFFTLKWYYEESEDEQSSLVMQTAKALPTTLQYLEWDSFQSDSYINDLISHCEAPLKKLIIGESYNRDKTKEELIKFCLRKQTLKYINTSCTDLNLKKGLEGYVEVVPYEQIVVNC
ncbi:hypothetical protein F8M41_023205 [Gigaspora margarita]|uniref:Uncharacterized protein n=1 Tax=Gigaspora margarita TaxID=4874 RepID=A0A8H4EHC9_GIGMA|nr:hypothetical protein F8M41_023205 [Gigaspora margarita]